MQVEIPGLQSRYLHSATAFPCAPGLVDVIVFGGCPNICSEVFEDAASYTGIANTTVLRLGKFTSLLQTLEQRRLSGGLLQSTKTILKVPRSGYQELFFTEKFFFPLLFVSEI